MMMVVSGGNVAMTLVLALLVMSPTISSCFVYFNTGWSTDRAVARRWDSNSCSGSSGSTGRPRARSWRSTSGYRQELTCGLQIMVRIRGKKSREGDYTNQAYDEYVKRLRPVLALDTLWHKTDEDLEAAVRKDPGVVVCLDEGGRQMNSQAFSEFVFSKLEEGGSRLTFVVGGAEGLPPGLKNKPPQGRAKLSLSSMTFTHLWARALLAEQIYRASEIRRGSKYHKM